MKLFYRIFFTALVTALLFSAASSNSAGKIAAVYADSTLTTSQDSLKVLEDQKEKISQGKILYEAKCQKCHPLYEPHAFKLKKWIRNLKEMEAKAQLNKSDYDLILDYLTAYCKK
jgi:Skp family chaperone for outer membrane proteins